MKNTFTRIRGSILIETMVATSILVVGLLVVYLGFVQTNRITLRNSLQGIALNAISTQLDKDSAVAYETLTNTNPPLTPITNLPNASITRQVTEDTDLAKAGVRLKKISYRLQWSGTAGNQVTQAQYEMTYSGVAND
jgi:type II secretory pathway component PulJ